MGGSRGGIGQIDCILEVVRHLQTLTSERTYGLWVRKMILANMWEKDYRAESRGWVRSKAPITKKRERDLIKDVGSSCPRALWAAC